MGNLKPINPDFQNTAGERKGMFNGNAPHPEPLEHVHDAGFTYAEFAKSEPATYGQGDVKTPTPK